MDAGLRDDSRTWRAIYPKVAGFTRVVVFDRAGMGKSESGPPPRTSARIAEELHTLLNRAAIPGPYILVGHATGGWNMRMFAHKYPTETAGLVLIDSPHEDFERRCQALLNPVERRVRNQAQEKERRHMPRAIRLEYSALEASRNQMKFVCKMPSVPLIVITAANHGFLPRQKAAQLEKLWLNLQRSLARLSRDSKLVIARKSRHYVQFDQPALVINEIREITEAVRSGKPLRRP